MFRAIPDASRDQETPSERRNDQPITISATLIQNFTIRRRIDESNNIIWVLLSGGGP